MAGRQFLVLLVLCLLPNAISGLWSDDTERWLQSLRPVIKPVISRKSTPTYNQPNPVKYFNRHKSMLGLVRMALDDYGPEFDNKVESFLEKLNTNNKPSAATFSCPSDVQCVQNTWTDYFTAYRKAADAIRNDPRSCRPCQFLLDVLQQLACEQSWETVRDNFIYFCEDLLMKPLGLDPVMCNGTITVQGSHVYCILKEASTFEMCESLNLCYPPTNNRKVEPHIPPVVKRRLAEKRGAEKNRNNRKLNGRAQLGNTLRIVQITDVHVQTMYAIGSPADCTAAVCCTRTSIPLDGTEYARLWGEYRCNLPERTLIKILEKISELKPDFIIYAGDSPPHTMWDETQQSQLNISDIVANAMKKVLPPGTRVYPNIGNHEMFPTNLYSSRLQETDQMTDVFTMMWHDLAGFDEDANMTWSRMSYYSVLHRPGLRILSINSNYDWYTANFYNTLNKNDSQNEEQKRFIEEVLTKAKINNEKVIIISHHPVGKSVVRTARWWRDVVIRHSDVIALHVSGHTHEDEFFLTIDPETDIAKGVNLVAPSVTTSVRINPSLRVLELDDVTYDLVNYQSYYFELDKQNPDVEPQIVLNYDMRSDYNVTDLSPHGWQKFALRFLEDESLFQLWYANRHAMAEQGPCALDGVCGPSCKKETICALWFPIADESDYCMDNWDNITRVWSSQGHVFDVAKATMSRPLLWTYLGLVTITTVILIA